VTRHAARKVAVHYERDAIVQRELLDMDVAVQRERLADIVRNEQCVRVHSQEFVFEDVFKKLTGQAYK
jgi:hypothetical protein